MAQRRANLFNNDFQAPDEGRAIGGIGGLLRRRREEIQQDIEDVSRQLRIRSVYLRAIEEGRFQELPGTAYAVGFVRAYADYLGLEGDVIVGDYRDELARRSRQNDLVWPSEGTESRFPGGTILVVCVLLGLAIYGGWFYATQSGGNGIKLIDQVPASLKKAIGVGQTAQNPSDSPKTEAQAAPMPQPVPNAAPPVTPPATANAAPLVPAAPATVATAAPNAQAPAVVATPSPTSPGAVALGDGAAPAAPTPPAVDAPAPQAPATQPTAPVPSAPATTQQAAVQASATPAPAKIVIRANRDSWIEIRDKDDAVVVQRVLRQGESFNVPDLKGLQMTTGNAGGIVIELEGKPLQSLGSLGVVKRGIKLDPVALADGSAFQTGDQ